VEGLFSAYSMVRLAMIGGYEAVRIAGAGGGASGGNQSETTSTVFFLNLLGRTWITYMKQMQLRLLGAFTGTESHGGSCGIMPVRVGFIVTSLERPSRVVVRVLTTAGTEVQWIKEGKQAVKMTPHLL